MSFIKFACPQCAQRIECDASYRGTEIQCPTCKAAFLLPHLPKTVDGTAFTPAFEIDYSRPELQGFNEFYLREIQPQLAIWENLFTRMIRQSIWWLFGGIAFTAMECVVGGWLIMTRFPDNDLAILLVSAVVVVTIFITIVQGWTVMLHFASTENGFITTEVARFFGMEYSQKFSDLEFEAFEDSGLLPRYDRKWSKGKLLENRIHGNHAGLVFDMFECSLRKKASTERGHVTPYSGVLFRFVLSNRFNGRTLVLKDCGSIGNYIKSFNSTGERIKLEDPHHERLFEVWSTDPIEASALLTPTLIERMVNLAKELHSKRIEFCFVDNLLLVSAHGGSPFAGGGTSRRVKEQRRVERLVNVVCRVFDLVNTLQLILKTRS